MWQNWVNGIMGLLIILVPFLNLSLAVERTVLILVGIIVAALGFWAAAGEKMMKPQEPAAPVPPSMPGSTGM